MTKMKSICWLTIWFESNYLLTKRRGRRSLYSVRLRQLAKSSPLLSRVGDRLLGLGLLFLRKYGRHFEFHLFRTIIFLKQKKVCDWFTRSSLFISCATGQSYISWQGVCWRFRACWPPPFFPRFCAESKAPFQAWPIAQDAAQVLSSFGIVRTALVFASHCLPPGRPKVKK